MESVRRAVNMMEKFGMELDLDKIEGFTGLRLTEEAVNEAVGRDVFKAAPPSPAPKPAAPPAAQAPRRKGRELSPQAQAKLRERQEREAAEERERQAAADREWEQMVAASRARADALVVKHGGSVAYQRLVESGMGYEIERARHEPTHPEWARDMEAELARLTPRIQVPVPTFDAYLFDRRTDPDWQLEDAIRAEYDEPLQEPRGFLLILPRSPNFTHGERWTRRDPDDWRNVLETRKPEAFTLNSVPNVHEERVVDPKTGRTHVKVSGVEWTMSDGYYSDPRTVYQHYGRDNLEIEINGLPMPEFGRLESWSTWPWNVIGHDLPLEPVTVRMRCVGIFDSMSDQFPVDGEWSRPVRIERAYRLDRIPEVFDTIYPDAQHGRNFSARLKRQRPLPAPSIQL